MPQDQSVITELDDSAVQDPAPEVSPHLAELRQEAAQIIASKEFATFCQLTTRIGPHRSADLLRGAEVLTDIDFLERAIASYKAFLGWVTQHPAK